MKVLVNVPDLERPGGVSVLFNVLEIEKRYKREVELFSIHSRLPFILGWLSKYFQFIFKIKKFDLIHVNPSLNAKSFFREAIYILICLALKKKVVVYWHGWEEGFEKKINESAFLKFIFSKTFGKVDFTIVLGDIFSKKLIDLGYHGIVILETNSADSKFLTQHRQKRSLIRKEKIKLLFIARLVKEKGIYEAIETVQKLNSGNQKYELYIAGSGKEENSVIQISEEDPNIHFLGYLKSQEKHQILINCDILFFPTYYPEGLPLTILEGMMYGLPIISRPVGGIPDIVKNGINGFIIDSRAPDDFCKLITKVVANIELYENVSRNNIDKSFLFGPEAVSERLMSYYKSVHNSSVEYKSI